MHDCIEIVFIHYYIFSFDFVCSLLVLYAKDQNICTTTPWCLQILTMITRFLYKVSKTCVDRHDRELNNEKLNTTQRDSKNRIPFVALLPPFYTCIRLINIGPPNSNSSHMAHQDCYRDYFCCLHSKILELDVLKYRPKRDCIVFKVGLHSISKLTSTYFLKTQHQQITNQKIKHFCCVA